MEATYELVIPGAFAHYLEGIHLLQTRDPQGDQEGAALLEAWDHATSRRGQTVLVIDFAQQGRGVLNYIREYADTVYLGGSDYTRSERTAATKVIERIVEINTRFRFDKAAAEEMAV